MLNPHLVLRLFTRDAQFVRIAGERDARLLSFMDGCRGFMRPAAAFAYRISGLGTAVRFKVGVATRGSPARKLEAIRRIFTRRPSPWLAAPEQKTRARTGRIGRSRPLAFGRRQKLRAQARADPGRRGEGERQHKGCPPSVTIPLSPRGRDGLSEVFPSIDFSPYGLRWV